MVRNYSFKKSKIQKGEEKRMSECEKMNCGYWFKGENDLFSCCHFEGPVDWAPCEQDEYEEEE